MSEERPITITRYEAHLEATIRELLEFLPMSGEYPYHCFSGGKSQALRAEADFVDRKDATVQKARKLVDYEPK